MTNRQNSSGGLLLPAIIGLLATLLCLPAGACGAMFGNVAVTPNLIGPVGQRNYGYAEQRFTIANADAKQHQVTLSMSGMTTGGGTNGTSGSYVLPAHSSRTVSIYIPPLGMSGNEVTVTIDGKRQRGGLYPHTWQFNWRWRSRVYYGGPPEQTLVMAGPEVTDLALSHFNDLINKFSGISAGGSRPGVSVQIKKTRLPVTQWSRHWLGFSPYAAIMVNQSSLDQMPRSVREALWGYVRTGGHLLLVNGQPSALPPAWRGSSMPSPTPDNLIRRYAVGFGTCWLCPASDMAGWDDTTWKVFQRSFLSTSKALQTQDTTNVNQAFPVVDHLGVPVRGLLAILGVFALVVGPLNIYLLRRKQRKIWLFATAPLLAFLFSAGVFGYATFSEGWTGVRRFTSFTILDQRARRATTIGWLGYYCPLTPGGGLHFSTQTELTPQIAPANPWENRSQGSRFVDWSSDQHLTSGWIAARVPTFFIVRKDAASRARVAISKSQSGQVTAVNGLGKAIETLVYADQAGQMYSAGPIAAGATATLKSQGASAPAPRDLGVELPADFSSSDWASMIQRLPNTLANRPEQGSYVAVLDASPFVEPGLKSTRRRSAPSVVLGIVSGDHHGN